MNFQNLVCVNDHKMNVFIAGNGEKTLVFLAGSGVTAPVLEYKPLYEKFIDTFQIAVVEKAGYGFSEWNTGAKRDVLTMVNESREALKNAGVQPPYILVAHSYSGIEAVYWANCFPEEVHAVLGLDMVTPQYALAQAAELPEEKKLVMLDKQKRMFEKLQRSKFLQKLLKNQTLNASGVWSNGALNDAEKTLYQDLFYKNLCNVEIREEQIEATNNAVLAVQTGKLKVPGHMFISNMKTPLKKTTWLAENTAFAKENGWQYETADNHFFYVSSPEQIASVWKKFMKTL